MLTYATRNEWTIGWDSHWFYRWVPAEQKTSIRGKGSYPLSSTLTQLDYLTEVPSSFGLEDAKFAAFIEATSIIEGRDVLEEFLSCGLWTLSEKFGFRVETKESPLSKVVGSMPQVTATIGEQESRAVFEVCIVNVVNLFVGN
jgi:hypothetical protein